MNNTLNIYAPVSNYSLGAVKICKWASEETTCFTANIMLDGKKVGDVSNDGHGGCDLPRFNTPAEREAYKAAADALPDYEFMGKTLSHGVDGLTAILMAEAEAAKHAKKWFTYIEEGADITDGFRYLTMGRKKCPKTDPGIVGWLVNNPGAVVIDPPAWLEQAIADAKEVSK